MYYHLYAKVCRPFFARFLCSTGDSLPVFCISDLLGYTFFGMPMFCNYTNFSKYNRKGKFIFIFLSHIFFTMYTYTSMCAWGYVCVYVGVYVNMYSCMYMRMYIYACIYFCACMPITVFVRTHMYVLKL